VAAPCERSASAGRLEQTLLAALNADAVVLVAELDDAVAGFVVVDLPSRRLEHMVTVAGTEASGARKVLAAAAQQLIGVPGDIACVLPAAAP
ncbi:hypothetical protein J8J32_20925, partial [Mycobacterium tuberculosis]|uniref:hypothetical protein n=1 Tax=Mycobacterium tuberculosis TaxID=1773 RepID=UPI001ADF13E4